MLRWGIGKFAHGNSSLQADAWTPGATITTALSEGPRPLNSKGRRRSASCAGSGATFQRPGGGGRRWVAAFQSALGMRGQAAEGAIDGFVDQVGFLTPGREGRS